MTAAAQGKRRTFTCSYGITHEKLGTGKAESARQFPALALPAAGQCPPSGTVFLACDDLSMRAQPLAANKDGT